MKQRGLIKENLRAPVLYTVFFIIMFHGGYSQYMMQGIYSSRWLVAIVGVITLYCTIPLQEAKGKWLFGIRTLLMLGGMIGGSLYKSPDVNMLWLYTYIFGYLITALLDSYDRTLWIYSAGLSAIIATMIACESMIQLSGQVENILFAVAGALPFAIGLIAYAANTIKEKK